MPKFELTAGERVTAMGLLPKEGDYVNVKTIFDARNVLGLNAAEQAAFIDRANTVPGNIAWTPAGMEAQPIEINEVAVEMIKAALEKLDREKKLMIGHYTLFNKLVREQYKEEDSNVVQKSE